MRFLQTTFGTGLLMYIKESLDDSRNMMQVLRALSTPQRFPEPTLQTRPVPMHPAPARQPVKLFKQAVNRGK